MINMGSYYVEPKETSMPRVAEGGRYRVGLYSGGIGSGLIGNYFGLLYCLRQPGYIYQATILIIRSGMNIIAAAHS